MTGVALDRSSLSPSTSADRVVELGCGHRCIEPRTATHDQHLAIVEQRRRVAEAGVGQAGCIGPSSADRVVELGRGHRPGLDRAHKRADATNDEHTTVGQACRGRWRGSDIGRAEVQDPDFGSNNSADASTWSPSRSLTPPTTSTLPSASRVTVWLPLGCFDLPRGGPSPGLRVIQLSHRDELAQLAAAADDEHLAIVEQRGGMVRSGLDQAPGGGPRSVRRVVQLTGRCVRATDDQHPAVGQQRGGVDTAGDDHVPGRRPRRLRLVRASMTVSGRDSTSAAP